jgi:hypothetical protein
MQDTEGPTDLTPNKREEIIQTERRRILFRSLALVLERQSRWQVVVWRHRCRFVHHEILVGAWRSRPWRVHVSLTSCTDMLMSLSSALSSLSTPLCISHDKV